MEKVIRVLMGRLGFIITLVILIGLWGIYSTWQIKKDYLPDIHNPILMVTVKTTVDSGNEKQLRDLRDDLATALKNVDSLQSVESTLYPQGLFLSLTFPQNIDIQKVQDKVKTTLATVPLPSGISHPEVTGISSNAFPFMQISLTSFGKHGSLSVIEANQIQKQLQQVSGVERVEATGNGQEGYVVTLDNKNLSAYDLTFEHVKKVLTSLETSLPSGTIQMSNLHLMLHVQPTKQNKQELEQISLGEKNGKEILLKDVATVQKGTVHVQTISRTQGQPSTLLNFYKTPSADVTKVSQNVKHKLAILKQNNKTLSIKTLFDNGQTTAHAIHGLWRETALGCLFSIICVFFFFRQWRATVAILLSLPICFFASVSLLKESGMTLNLLTASGLIVAMGRVVDDSIVVIDNMYREVEMKGKFSIAALANGAKDMIPAVTASTLTTIAVYLPLAMTGTMIGHAFSGFAWAVTIALICSLIVALVLVPPFTARAWSTSFVPRAPRTEKRASLILVSLFKKRHILLPIFCLLLLVSAIGAFYLPVNILPRSRTHDINVQIESHDEGATLSQIDSEVRSLEAVLNNHKDILSYSSTLGSAFTPTFDDVFDQGGGWIQQSNVANVYITPKQGVDTDKVVNSLKEDVKQLPTTATYTVTNQQIAGDDSQVKLTLSGLNENKLIQSANFLKSKLQTIDGLQIHVDSDQSDTPRFAVELNDEKIRLLGINKQVVLKAIDRFIDKNAELNIPSDSGDLPIEIHKPSAVSFSFEQGEDSIQVLLLKLGRLTFKGKDQQRVPLAEIAKLHVNRSTITSEKDGEPIAIITSNIITPDIEGVTKKITNFKRQPFTEGPSCRVWRYSSTSSTNDSFGYFRRCVVHSSCFLNYNKYFQRHPCTTCCFIIPSFCFSRFSFVIDYL